MDYFCHWKLNADWNYISLRISLFNVYCFKNLKDNYMLSDRVHNGPGKNMYIVILMTTIRKIYDIFQLTLRNHNLVLKV